MCLEHVDRGASSCRRDVSPCDLTRRVRIECLVRDDPLEPHVLLLEVPQPLRTISLNAAVLVTPPVQSLLCRLSGRRALTSKALRLTELADELFMGMPSRHLWSLPPARASGSHRYRTSPTGAGQHHSKPSNMETSSMA